MDHPPNETGAHPTLPTPTAANALKQPKGSSKGLFSMSFSPPPKREEDTRVYNFQEESAARAFMRGAFVCVCVEWVLHASGR